MSNLRLQPDDTRHADRQGLTLAMAGGAAIAGAALWLAWKRTRRNRNQAPGWPGAIAHWNHSSKDGVGTAVGPGGAPGGHVWFTIRRGAFSEIFYPRADLPAVRDWGMVVTDHLGFYSDEVVAAKHETTWLADGVPAFRIINTCRDGRYRIEKTVFAHPRRDAVLQLTRFQAGQPGPGLRLFSVFSPHLGNRGSDNTARASQFRDQPILAAERENDFLALACSTGWQACSVGFVDSARGPRRELMRTGRLARRFGSARHGNVELAGEVDVAASAGQFVLALGFGRTASEAMQCARASLLDDFDELQNEYITHWLEWQRALRTPRSRPTAGRDLFHASTAILRSHEDRTGLGGAVASLSIPWGETRTDSTGETGYHVVWPRDLAEIAGGLLAAGARDEALRSLRYFEATQESDGHWAQNQWLDGTRNWKSIQLDETALPILLLNQLMSEGVITDQSVSRYWPMVRAAAGYLLCNGPSTLEDRWENARGFTPFTLAVSIAATVVAADIAEACAEPALGALFRDTADAWNDSLERWTYVEGTKLADEVGVTGYYLRVAPPGPHGNPAKYDAKAGLGHKRPSDSKGFSPSAIVSPDSLAYVRFGLRSPDDPRVVNTIKVIDAILKVETPNGPAWHRYNHDGYGEKDDGSPFDRRRGIGRVWPLLTGERADFELAAGRKDEAERLLAVMASFANATGMLPEQVWDRADIPERDLYFGKPTGSAMPLAWAHAEYLKLRRSIENNRVFDMPAQTERRYLVEKTDSRVVT